MSRRKQARPIRHLDGDDDGVDGAEGQLGAELTPTVDGDGDQATGTSSSSLLQLPLNMDDGDDSLPPRAATGECVCFSSSSFFNFRSTYGRRFRRRCRRRRR